MPSGDPGPVEPACDVDPAACREAVEHWALEPAAPVVMVLVLAAVVGVGVVAIGYWRVDVDAQLRVEWSAMFAAVLAAWAVAAGGTAVGAPLWVLAGVGGVSGYLAHAGVCRWGDRPLGAVVGL